MLPASSLSEIGCTYLARQAIYDRSLNVVAYELLHRCGHDNHAVFSDGDRATGEVVFNAVVEIGLEQVIGQEMAFINVTRDFLLGGFCEAFRKIASF
jgi:EAL and modified HD-GYP domain-containing signal transduction protein